MRSLRASSGLCPDEAPRPLLSQPDRVRSPRGAGQWRGHEPTSRRRCRAQQPEGSSARDPGAGPGARGARRRGGRPNPARSSEDSDPAAGRRRRARPRREPTWAGRPSNAPARKPARPRFRPRRPRPSGSAGDPGPPRASFRRPLGPHRLPGRTHVDRVDVGFVEEAERPAQLQGRGDAVIPRLKLQVPVSGAEGEEVLAAQATSGSRQQQLQEQRPRPRSLAAADRAQHVPKLSPANPAARRSEAEEGGDVTGRPPRPLRAARLPLLPPRERGGTGVGREGGRPAPSRARRGGCPMAARGTAGATPDTAPGPGRVALVPRGSAAPVAAAPEAALVPRRWALPEAGTERGALHSRPGSGAGRAGAEAAPIPGHRPPSAA